MEKNYYIVIDTETTGTIEKPFAYDIGWAVIDEQGAVYEARSYVCEEIFMDIERMHDAYYGNKRPMYWDDIEDGSRLMRKFSTIRMMFFRDCKKWNVCGIVAHNAPFDYRSTNNTQRLLSEKYRYFFPYGIPIFDSLSMARKTINKTEEYTKFCNENGFICKNGRNRLTAEVLYRYLTQNLGFDESHTALEDVMIEKDIFITCLRMMNEVNE